MKPKPCPKCKSEKIREDMDLNICWLFCTDCKTCGPEEKSFTAATVAWNDMERGGEQK